MRKIAALQYNEKYDRMVFRERDNRLVLKETERYQEVLSYCLNSGINKEFSASEIHKGSPFFSTFPYPSTVARTLIKMMGSKLVCIVPKGRTNIKIYRLTDATRISLGNMKDNQVLLDERHLVLNHKPE